MNHDQETETLSHVPDEEGDAPAEATDAASPAEPAPEAEPTPETEAEPEPTPETEPEPVSTPETEAEPVSTPETEAEPVSTPEPEPPADDFSDPHATIADSEDPEAAARAALGLGERPEETELRPEEAAAILARVEAEEEEEEVVLAEAALSDADLVDVYDEEAEAPTEPSPYDRAGAWYVVHTYSGYEKKVKSNLESRVKSLHMEGRIHEVVIPMDDVIEFKGGKKTVVQKKVFPGYLLVRMDLDDETWGAVRNTPGVTGFVGSGAKPTPLSRKEVDSILRVRPEDEAKKARPRLEFEVGDQVRVTAGPFADFNGLIDEINVDQSTLKVLVNIFGRETPVTLDFADVAKL